MKEYTVEEISSFNNKQKVEFYKEVCGENKFCILHPVNKALTFSHISAQKSLCNIILFCDENHENQWYYIQEKEVLDYYLVDEKLVPLKGNKKINTSLTNLIKNLNLKPTPSKKHGNFDGILLSSTRPYHFFFDQYVNVFHFHNLIPDNKLHIDKYSFYDELPEKKIPTKNDGCFLLPIVKSYNSNDKKNHDVYKYLTSQFTNNEIEKKNTDEITIWFGITGQKRCWKEQVNGCVSLINEVKKNYSAVHLIIDGWTSSTAKKEECPEDELIFKEIKKQISDKDIFLKNIISETVINKIKLGSDIDFFVANSGTGCMIPSVFLNKKGVTHGRLSLFDEVNSSNKIKIPEDLMHIEYTDNKARDSYSFHWTIIYNSLIDLGLKGTKLPVKSYKKSKKETSKEINLTYSTQSELYKDVALKFEELGDIDTALKIMKIALSLKPHGPFIKKKTNQYKSSLINEFKKHLDMDN